MSLSGQHQSNTRNARSNKTNAPGLWRKQIKLPSLLHPFYSITILLPLRITQLVAISLILEDLAAVNTAAQPTMYNIHGSFGGASSAKTGPSSCEWSEYKETIVKLYKAHSLKYVMRVMEDRHGFRASKRQYDRKFELWGVSKNLKAVEKEKILNILAGEGAWALDSSRTSPNNYRTTIEPDHYRKAIRHRKAKYRRSSSTSQPASKHSGSSTLSPDSSSSSSFSDVGRSPTQNVIPWMSLTAEPTMYSPCDPDQSDKVCLRMLDTPPHLNSTVSVSGSNDEETWSWVDIDSPRRENAVANSSSEREQTGEVSTYNICSRDTGMFPLLKTIALVPDGTAQINVERLLKGLYNCVSILADPNIHVIRRQCCSPWPSAGARFWSEVANGIYLLKVDSDLACYALNKAGRLVDSALSDARSLTVKFIREFFLTLSPGNTKVNPFVRKMLLQLLQSRASMLLGKQHCITDISTELLKDGDDQEISELGLRCCVDAIYANRGLNDSSGLAIEVESAIIRSHRRNGDLELAAAEALSLYRKTSRKLHHQQTMPGTTAEDIQGYRKQLRLAATELAHVRMDQRENHYDEATRMCLVALTGTEQSSNTLDTSAMPPSPSSVPGQVQDKAAIHTAEDLAKIAHELGFLHRAVEWLRSAEALAMRLIGPGEQETVTAHITEKLKELVAEVCGSSEGAV